MMIYLFEITQIIKVWNSGKDWKIAQKAEFMIKWKKWKMWIKSR